MDWASTSGRLLRGWRFWPNRDLHPNVGCSRSGRHESIQTNRSSSKIRCSNDSGVNFRYFG